MGSSQKIKGTNFEREIQRLLGKDGIPAERVPNSGNSGGTFSDDIQLEIDGVRKKFECKIKKHGKGFAMLYQWIEPCDGLFLRADYKKPLVVLTYEQFAELMKR